MIYSQGGSMSVLELVVMVTVAVVVVGGCVPPMVGVVNGGRGTSWLTIVTGPRIYVEGTQQKEERNNIVMAVVVLVGLISVNMMFRYPVDVIVE
jgi:hypothetical protein